MMSRPFSRRSFLATAGLASAAAATKTSLFWTPELRAEMPMPPSSAPGASTSISRALDAYIAAYMPAMNAPGLTLGLTNRTETLRAAGYGFANVDLKQPVTPEHLFQIGSITKSFVAIVCLQLHQEGKLDLHKPVLDYLPALPIITEYGPVAAHDLLTHSSGLPDNLALFSADPAARLLQAYKPGEHFHYCNAGFDILGLLIAKLDNRPWRIAVTERVFKPLGMTATTPVIHTSSRDRVAIGYQSYWDNEVYPRHGKLTPAPNLVMDDTAGCIQSTPGDMARYARMLLNRGVYPGGRILSEESFTLFTTPHIKAEEFSPTSSYGYGIAVDTLDGHKILRHTGGMVAFASSIHVDLDGGIAAFASINAMQGYRPTAVTEYAVRLLRAESEHKPLPAQPTLADPLEVKNAADYAGAYEAPGGRKLTFVADGNRLSLDDGATKIPLQQAGGDSFLSTVPHAHAGYTFDFGRKETNAHPGDKLDGKAPPPPVVEVTYGPDWYTNASYAGPRIFIAPPDAHIFTGYYRSDSPWGGSADVYILKGRLTLDGTPLLRLGAGLYRVGDPDWNPITAQFLHIFDGKARLLRLAGMDCWRLEVE